MNRKSNDCNSNVNDYGPGPFIGDINRMAKRNNYFRNTLWTGEFFQITLMSIPVGGEIGLEAHQVDQYLRIEEGSGLVMMGPRKGYIDLRKSVCENYGIFVPAGIWHNIKNCGHCPLKISSLYAPPQHPPGTIHETKEIADQEEHYY